MTRILVTGITGTLGSAFKEVLQRYPIKITSIGRQSVHLPSPHEHIHADFANPAEVSEACKRLLEGECIGFALFCAGVDSYLGITNFGIDALEYAMRINCIAHLQLLQALVNQKFSPKAVRLVIASSNIVDTLEPNSLVYGVTKRALEDGIHFAVNEETRVALRVLCLRLPAFGTKMAEAAESGRVTEIRLRDLTRLWPFVQLGEEFLFGSSVNLEQPSFRVQSFASE